MKNHRDVTSIKQRSDHVNERLLSVKEAAEHLCVSTSWLYRSDVPYVKICRRKHYRPSDLARYVNARVSHRLGLDDA